MRLVGGSLVSFLALGVVTSGCGGDDNSHHTGKHDIWFMGAVVDGAAGTPIAAYTITLVSGTTTTKGKVDAATGRFTLGPLEAWNDYGVVIESDGYRKFSSYNPGIAPPSLGGANSTTADIYSADTTQTFNFNASLFPMALAAPDIAITVIGAAMMPPSGRIRLQPTSQPGLLNQPSEVAGQAWNNDNDLYAAAVSDAFTGGTYTVPAAKLVYGVSYTVSVYGVDGYQPTNNQNQATVQAGVNTAASVTLVQQVVPPPMLVSSTIASCRAPTSLTDTSSAVVTLTFNVPIFDGTTTIGGAAEALDNGLAVNFNFPSTSQVPPPGVPNTTQERGTSFSITGNVLTLSWNANVGVAIKGTGDTIRSVTYGGYIGSLNNVFVQPDKHPDSRVSLGSLVPGGVITCNAP